MDWGYTVFFMMIFTGLLLIVQRTEDRRRRVSWAIFWLLALMIRHLAFLRDTHSETLVAFLGGLFLSFLFWLLIGRYNPVGSSDSIQVIGLDD